jgi:hypothetical protein
VKGRVPNNPDVLRALSAKSDFQPAGKGECGISILLDTSITFFALSRCIIKMDESYGKVGDDA